LNHNAFSDNDYVNPKFNAFLHAGGYPGFCTSKSRRRNRPRWGARYLW
jgi:hypothetical protein